MSSGFHLPFTVRSTIPYQSGLRHPVAAVDTGRRHTSYFTFVVWRNDDFSVAAEEIITFDLAIGAEDKAMLEQVPACSRSTRPRHGQRAVRQGVVEWRRQFATILASPASESDRLKGAFADETAGVQWGLFLGLADPVAAEIAWGRLRRAGHRHRAHPTICERCSRNSRRSPPTRSRRRCGSGTTIRRR